MSQIFRSFEANSGTIQRKGSEDLAKSSTSTVDSSNLGQAPRELNTFGRSLGLVLFCCGAGLNGGSVR
ncbi:MAG: hypothetical protein IH978_09865 [Nitrospinae bacterium]|nr:hypothetical protein [Nitrospinota bacterium]